nr:hypothetical protein [Anaerolineae bacterium]
MIDLLTDILLMGFMLLALYGIGRVVRRLVRIEFWSRSADLAFSFAFGLGTVSTVLFLLSLVGWLKPAAGWAILIIGCLAALLAPGNLKSDFSALFSLIRKVWQAPTLIKLLVLVVLLFPLMNLVANLAPPVEGDTVHQYLLLPRIWVEQGHYVQPAHIWAGTLPGNMMMISAWALLLNGSLSLATLITGLGMSLLLSLGVYAFARLYFGQGTALLAAAAIYTMPDAIYLAQSAKVDMGWAFYEVLALAAFFRWIDLTPRRLFQEQPATPGDGAYSWLILSGVCLGLAAGSKNQTLISIALLGLWLIIRMIWHGDWRGLLRAGLAFGLAVVLAMSPFYLYNLIAHRNPFYPVFADLFVNLWGGTPSPRSELGTEIFYPWSISGYLLNLWNTSLGHTRPGFYLGFIAGPLFLLAVPVGFVLNLYRRKPVIWRMLGYAFVFSIVWFLVKQAARHFLPGLILLSVITGYVLWTIASRRHIGAYVVLAGALLMVSWNFISGLGVLYWNGAYRVALGIENRTQYLERWHNEVIDPTFPDWETILFLNEQIDADARVLSVHATSPLYITPDFVPANWGMRGRFDTVTDEAILLDMLMQHRIDYILVYKIDDNSEWLFTRPTFVERYGSVIYDGPRTMLYHLELAQSD